LIRKYYAQEKPLPADLAATQRLVSARTKEEKEAVETVLSEFFELRDDGWHNRRCDEEIERYLDKQIKAKRSAEARWNREPAHTDGNANAMRTHSEGNAHQTPDTNHQTPISSSSKKKTQPTQKPIGVSDEVWQSFSLIRKAKRAPITDVAMLGIRREAVKAGIELEQALTICCERGWAGFKAEWMQGHQGKPQAESFYERDKRAKRNEMAKWAPGIAAREPEDFNTIEGDNHVIAIESD
jgi:uncharacterized protein YdaU (DUF1376 family)